MTKQCAAGALLTCWGLMVALAAAACWCAGCQPITPANLAPDDERALQALIQAAKDSGLYRKDCLLEDMRVKRTTSASEFRGLCHAMPEAAASCLGTRNVNRGVTTVGEPMPILRPGEPAIGSSGGAIVHELVHWVGDCSLNDIDTYHENPRLFVQPGKTAAEKNASLQGRARILLGYSALQ